MDATQHEFWSRNGYIVIPNVIRPATTQDLLATTRQMLDDFPLDGHPMTKFSTGRSDVEDAVSSDSQSRARAQPEHVSDDYFLTSGDKIRFFFEEDAFAPDSQDSSRTHLKKPKAQAINKIGHFLHELSPPFRAITFTNLHVRLCKAVGFRDPRVLQSMIICKQPEIGGEVPPHQDSTFLYTDPPSAVGFWIALEDATRHNGCLSFARGSHRHCPIKHRFVRKGGNSGTEFIDLNGPGFPQAERPNDIAADPESAEHSNGKYGEDEYEIEEVKAGSLVMIHGNVLHKSKKNHSSKSRFIYTFHVIEGDNQSHVYDERNWLQPPENGFSRMTMIEA